MSPRHSLSTCNTLVRRPFGRLTCHLLTGSVGHVQVDLRSRVNDEMRHRGGWSVRRLATEAVKRGARTTNTTLTRWFNEGGPPTANVREAIAAAFDWNHDWPENPPEGSPLPAEAQVTLELVHADIAKLRRELKEHRDAVEAVDGTRRVIEELRKQLERLTREVEAARIARRLPPR